MLKSFFCTVLSWLAFEQQQQFKANSLQLLHKIQQNNDFFFLLMNQKLHMKDFYFKCEFVIGNTVKSDYDNDKYTSAFSIFK